MSLESVFLNILSMSISGAVAILIILLLRLLLKKAPKVISYALWAIVLLRLLCPIAPESAFSAFSIIKTPKIEPAALVESYEPISTEYIPQENTASNSSPSKEYPFYEKSEAESEPENSLNLIKTATYIWITGAVAMGFYGFASYLRLRKRLVTAVPIRKNIYRADGIPSPFVLGLLRPKIFLPSDGEEWEKPYVLLHEQIHIRRGDHIVKLLAFATLCIHWFNPMVWIAFAQAGKDMEMSCDEAVIKKLGSSVLKNYSTSLLNLSIGKPAIALMPLSFGEEDPKGRINNLSKWKKPKLLVILIAVIIGIIASVTLLTNPIGIRHKNEENLEKAVRQAVYSEIQKPQEEGTFACESHKILSITDISKPFYEKTYFFNVSAVVLYQEYDLNGSVIYQWYTPMKLTFDESTDGEYILKQCLWPVSDRDFETELRKIFSKRDADDVLNGSEIQKELEQNCDEHANAWIQNEHTQTVSISADSVSSGVQLLVIEGSYEFEGNFNDEPLWATEAELKKYEEFLFAINGKDIKTLIAVISPGDETIVTELTREQTAEILNRLKTARPALFKEPENPSTGGGNTLYIETAGKKAIISDNGNWFTVSLEGEPNRWIFSTEWEKSSDIANIWAPAIKALEDKKAFQTEEE